MLEELRRRTSRSGLEIIHVNLWEGGSAFTEARNYCDLWSVGGAVLVDETGEYAEHLGIRGVPTNVFVDAGGSVTAVTGVRPEELEAEVSRLLGPAWTG